MPRRATTALLLTVALALSACGDDGDDAAGTTSTTTTSAPRDPTTTAPPADDGVVDTPPPVTVEGADDAVRAWVEALSTGATDEAWALVHPRSQEAFGGRKAFGGDASALAEGYGAWAAAEDVSYGIVPLAADDPGLSIVVLGGTIAQEGPPEPSVAAIPVRTSEDGTSLVDPFHDLGGAGLELEPAPGTEIAPDPTFEVLVPAQRDVRFIVDDRGAFEPASEAADGDLQRVTGTPQQPLAPGRHSLTVVLLGDGDVQARAVLYGVEG